MKDVQNAAIMAQRITVIIRRSRVATTGDTPSLHFSDNLRFMAD